MSRPEAGRYRTDLRRGAINRTDARATRETTLRVRDAPSSMWWGLVIGVLGFVISLSHATTSTVDGQVVECSYFDGAALFAAAVCLTCGIHALVARLRIPSRYPIEAGVVFGVSGVLVILAVVHALRAFGAIGGIC